MRKVMRLVVALGLFLATGCASARPPVTRLAQSECQDWAEQEYRSKRNLSIGVGLAGIVVGAVVGSLEEWNGDGAAFGGAVPIALGVVATTVGPMEAAKSRNEHMLLCNMDRPDSVRGGGR